MPAALTIAGSDPSGGAGLQADLKTFHQFGVYGQAVVTLITVQNTTRAGRVEVLDANLVEEQIQAVIEDIPPAAAKTGALGNRAVTDRVAALAAGWTFPLVVDPVMIGKHGAALLGRDAFAALIENLIPRAYLLTPNLPEAAALTGLDPIDSASMRRACEALARAGARSVLIKGGHLEGDAIDILLFEGAWFEYSSPRIRTRHTHGSGCTYSAAITAGLANGLALPDAVGAAKRFIQAAIETAPGLGKGAGPVNHHAAPARAT